MKRKIISKITILFLISSIVFSFCGCGSAFELTNEESKLIAEYAAGLILKHSGNYSGSLVEYYDQPDDELVQKINDAEVKKEEIAELENAEPESADSSNGESGKKPDTIYTTNNIAESIGLEGFTIDYKDYEITDTYPKDGNDMTFTLDAASGKHLLVLHFDINNISGEERECNVLSINPSFRIVANGKKRINEQQTILLDDLKQYKANVGSSADAVLIFEVDDEIAGNIEQIDLYVKCNGEQSVHKLK